MGRNNQQRRAARKRRRQRDQRPGDPARPPRSSRDAPGPASSGGTTPSTSGRDRDLSGHGHRCSAPPPAELLDAAVTAWQIDAVRFAQLRDALVARTASSLPLTEARVAGAIDRLWGLGWTPADLVHVAARQLTAHHAPVAAEQVVSDGRRRVGVGQTVHPRWAEQLDALAEEHGSVGPQPPEQRLGHLVELLCLVVRLPSVPTTVPRPGEHGSALASAGAHLDARMLARVRALLAKAESTTFEDEAEAFTAKAQELIARHAIDEALLHTVHDVGDPSVRRIPIDDPYADAKAALIAAVAGANRCRVVHSPAMGWVTAFGYDHDLDAVELLGVSLLAQATTAMLRLGPQRDATGRSRTRAFRRAFLFGFAHRIGERLRRATEGQMAATDDRSGRLVPVLAARDERLRVAEAAAFPEAVSRTTSVSNATGWHAGQAAAEQADLAVAAHRLAGS
jgi:hypothetical protein